MAKHTFIQAPQKILKAFFHSENGLEMELFIRKRDCQKWQSWAAEKGWYAIIK